MPSGKHRETDIITGHVISVIVKLMYRVKTKKIITSPTGKVESWMETKTLLESFAFEAKAIKSLENADRQEIFSSSVKFDLVMSHGFLSPSRPREYYM